MFDRLFGFVTSSWFGNILAEPIKTLPSKRKSLINEDVSEKNKKTSLVKACFRWRITGWGSENDSFLNQHSKLTLESVCRASPKEVLVRQLRPKFPRAKESHLSSAPIEFFGFRHIPVICIPKEPLETRRKLKESFSQDTFSLSSYSVFFGNERKSTRWCSMETTNVHPGKLSFSA